MSWIKTGGLFMILCLTPTSGVPGIEKVNEDEKIIFLDDMISQYILRALKKTGGQIEGHKDAATLLNLNPNTLRM